MLKLKLQYFGHLMRRTDSLGKNKTLMLGKIEGRRRRGWQRMRWMASPTQWTRVWASSAAAAAKSLQSCLTLCDPIDSSPPGSPVPGILQARTLQWVAMSFSNAWKWSRSVMSDPQRPHGLQLTRLLCPCDFPGKSTGVGCHCLFRWASSRSWLWIGKLGMLQSMGSQRVRHDWMTAELAPSALHGPPSDLAHSMLYKLIKYACYFLFSINKTLEECFNI